MCHTRAVYDNIRNLLLISVVAMHYNLLGNACRVWNIAIRHIVYVLKMLLLNITMFHTLYQAYSEETKFTLVLDVVYCSLILGRFD